jgi:hypothetical protein
MLMHWVVILTPFGLFVYVFGNLSSTTSERLNSCSNRFMFITVNGILEIIRKNYLFPGFYSEAD